MSVSIYSPAGPVARTSIALAARPSELRGLRIAVLENSKTNARLLLTSVAETIAQRYGAELSTVEAKPSAGVPVDDERLARIVASADLALVGTAD